jgi:sugar diacid utilization regulator
VLLLDADGEPSPDAFELLHLAAVTCLTEVAIEEAREQVEQSVRGSFLEDLRARHDLGGDEIAGRAQRLGCHLDGGAVAVCAHLTSGRPRQVLATIAGEHPGAIAEHLDGRVYALLPAEVDGDETTLVAARALAVRLESHGTVGVSSFYADPADLPRAIQEAELMVEVLRHGNIPVAEDIAGGAYRLLFRVLASDPAEIRSFYEDTVAPIVGYDRQYHTDLTGTLETYLGQNCNMNATAAAIFAHRHTVGYRLERIRELTGLDPMLSEDRERLGLGLKAYRIIAPRLPK